MLQLKGYTKVITQESCEIKFSGHTKQTLNRVALITVLFNQPNVTVTQHYILQQAFSNDS